ncbi:MAG: hypothetical protein L0191_09625, partial [Acidobacteria bacterium]|nr:hypothetical protein [Acidobacteriota bacterium]
CLNNNVPEDYRVRWEVRDPDDPATHSDLDSNDTAGPKGGDNYDRTPAVVYQRKWHRGQVRDGLLPGG